MVESSDNVGLLFKLIIMSDFLLFGFIDYKTFWVIVHLLGVVLGAGGAFLTDMMYLTSINDKVITKSELRFVKLGSRFVWMGLLVIIISGIFIFFTNIDAYMQSSKFISKMTIVLILLINGLVFHFIHLPVLGRNLGVYLPNSLDFKHRSFGLYLSGAISVISWVVVLVLGSLKQVPYSFFQIFSFYLVLILIASLFALVVRYRFLRLK